MATSKQYAWYLEGNQVAIVEKDVSFDNNELNKDYGPGASRQRWESPQSSVIDGLEVKYVYAPTYRVKSTGNEGTDVHRFIAWGSDGTTVTAEGVVFSLNAGTAAHDFADGIFLDVVDLIVLKLPNTVVENFHAVTVRVGSGYPSGAGAGNVRVRIAAILENVD